jgi:hypothetical protein
LRQVALDAEDPVVGLLRRQELRHAVLDLQLVDALELLVTAPARAQTRGVARGPSEVHARSPLVVGIGAVTLLVPAQAHLRGEPIRHHHAAREVGRDVVAGRLAVRDTELVHPALRAPRAVELHAQHVVVPFVVDRAGALAGIDHGAVTFQCHVRVGGDGSASEVGRELVRECRPDAGIAVGRIGELGFLGVLHLGAVVREQHVQAGVRMVAECVRHGDAPQPARLFRHGARA